MSRIRCVAVALVALLPSTALAASKVTSLDFRNDGDSSVLEIRSDGPLTFDKQENAQDKQIVIDLSGAKLLPAASRKLDTSSFDSDVSLISPYQVQGSPDKARIVIQLRDQASADVTQDGNLIKVKIPKDASGKGTQVADNSAASAAADTTAAPPADDSGAAAAPDSASAAAPGDSSSSTPPDQQGSDAAPPPPAATGDASTPGAAPPDGQQSDQQQGTDQASAASADPQVKKLNQFMEARETKRFIGKPITLKVRNADVGDVLRMIGEASGFNVVVGSDVQGQLSLSLTDVPWDQALDVVLHTLQLGAERNNNVLRVVTLANLTAEKQNELNAKHAIEATAPRVTKVFPISYADPSALSAILQAFATASSNGSTVPPAVVQVDQRTNSIIVQGLADNVERMQKLIQILDTQTPQVLIEAKVVEATEQFANGMSGSLGVGGNGRNPYFTAFNGGNPLDSLFPSLTSQNPIFSNGAAATGGLQVPISSRFGFSPSIGFLPGIQRLNAILSLGETEGQVKVVTTPRLVVLNKQQATITQSEPVLGPVQVTSVSGGPTTSTQPILQANISLNVTPAVTNDGSVSMQLSLERDVPQSNGTVANRHLQTQVLVDGGTTLVIGGVYTVTKIDDSSGFPFLRKIPIIGWFFGNTTHSTTHTELFFFVTPKVLNANESGIAS